MVLRANEYIWRDPVRYARKVLGGCGFSKPPICEMTVAEYIGLGIKYFWRRDIPEGEARPEIADNILAWLQRKPNGKSRIWVRRDIDYYRQRMSVFHECGHAIIPWHQELDCMCAASDLRSNAQKECEREAYACGCELMMPAEMFVPDALYLEAACRGPYIGGLNLLSMSCQASLEATAIRYAELHPSPRAVLIVEQVGNETSGRYNLRVRLTCPH